MKQFMDKDFMLSTDTAKTLFHDYAENMPILDYHCHINPKEIAEDRKFENMLQTERSSKSGLRHLPKPSAPHSITGAILSFRDTSTTMVF